jgi:ABC-type uncharacterized transport system substrate-binding protein
VNRKQLAAKTRERVMSNKIFYLALVAMLLVLGFPAEAQQAAKVPRIGFLSALSPDGVPAWLEAFRQGLRDLGYIEGKNTVIEWRFAEGKLNRLPSLASELVSLKLDVIVSGGPSVTRAAKEATSTIPIVMGFETILLARGSSPASLDLAGTLRDCQTLLRR